MRTQQAAIAARYRRCATQETAGVSPLYAALAEAGHLIWMTPVSRVFTLALVRYDFEQLQEVFR